MNNYTSLRDHRIAIIQPMIPSYRKAFFEKLSILIKFDLYIYHSSQYLSSNGFSPSNLRTKRLRSFRLGKALLFAIAPLFSRHYSIYVLCGERKLLCNWIFLILSRLFGKRVVIWGHGIDARRYEACITRMPFSYRLMYRLTHGAWFYTDIERKLWNKLLPNLKSVALGNTVSISSTDKSYSSEEKHAFRSKHNIHTQINFIYCARFSSKHRRVDLLLKIIKDLDPAIYGFIIIGDGPLKPDLSAFANVYDQGPLYDDLIKSQLFAVADAYLQPAWTGLSIVEAMAYGKPILTLKRSTDIMHGVEYGYIEHEKNGMTFEDINSLIAYMTTATSSDYARLGLNAKQYYHEKLSIDNMVSNAIRGINMVLE
jgi:glycosyltransferase involved in cell wall biosynthesis